MYYDMTLVSVDDNTVNLMLVEAMTKELGLTVKSFVSAKDALAYLAYNPVDIVLTDYMMPEMHGIDFIKSFRHKHHDVPVVMITAVTDDKQLRQDALEAGATEFLNKPLNSYEFKARLTNLINLRKAHLLLRDRAKLLEDEVRKAVREIEEREIETLLILGRASEYKDHDTATHINRVAGYSTMILREYGANIYEQQLMFYSAPLHDIGKLGIPDHVLTKPGVYTPEEFEVMKKHTTLGYEMVKDAVSPYLQKGAEIALTHHEKFNGKGYPYGVKGADIPLFGRVVAIADVFDALTSSRPYKEAWSIDKAVSLLKSERGEHFDPKLVDIFVDNIDKLLAIYSRQKENPMKFEDFD